MNDQPQITLVYDGECPVCTAYSKAVALRALDPGFSVVSARERNPIVEDVRRRGLDMDEGIVLRVGEQYYHGAEAMHRLTLLTTQNGFFNRLNYAVFRSRRLAHLLYPALRLGRNTLLILLGRRKIKAANGS